MPWSTKSRKNLVFLMDDPANLDKVLRHVKTKVIYYNYFNCF
jgi:hypothetical protein